MLIKKPAVMLLLAMCLSLAVLLFANRTLMITYSVVHKDVVNIPNKNIRDISKSIKLYQSNKFGSKFAYKVIKGHPGNLDESKNYSFIQFGYCSFFECLVFSNNFSQHEFNIFYYKNYMLPFSDTKELINAAHNILNQEKLKAE